MTTIIPVKEIKRRLKELIPGPLSPRGIATSLCAARTVFVMLYGFAMEGKDRWIRPTAVGDMSDDQAMRRDFNIRKSWLDRVQSRKNRPRRIDDRWYQENSRETIRKSIKALIDLGIIVTRPGIATNSSSPRYALSKDFVPLMSSELVGSELSRRLEKWRDGHLSKSARSRISLLRRGLGKDGQRVLITLPGGETRSIEPGPSAPLTKAVVEEFATRFLRDPVVLLISESANKVGYEDREQLSLAGLNIDPKSTLPDVVLMDVDPDPPLLVFVECVATVGPVDKRRKSELDKLAGDSGFDASSFTYVTVFHDRASKLYRSMATTIAWASFVWFETEPEYIIYLSAKKARHTTTLQDLLDAG